VHWRRIVTSILSRTPSNPQATDGRPRAHSLNEPDLGSSDDALEDEYDDEFDDDEDDEFDDDDWEDEADDEFEELEGE
jgi:hypothetical protein